MRPSTVDPTDDLAARLARIEGAIDNLAARQASEFTRLSDLIDRNGSKVAAALEAAPVDEIPPVPQAPAAGVSDGATVSNGESDETRTLKRKYRRVQADAERLRNELVELQRQLALARTAPVTTSNNVAGKIEHALHQLLQRVPGFAKQLERSRLRRELAVINSSELFNPTWYRATYSDVAAAGLDPAVHYLRSGWLETRDPGPDFSTSGYLKANPDVARSGANPLIHYIEHGMSEGRSIGVGAQPRVEPSTEKFDPPAPCVQFPLPPQEQLRWMRGYALNRSGAGSVVLDGITIGSSLCSDQVLAAALERFVRLTDAPLRTALGPIQSNELQVEIALPTLADCWFSGELTMRMHWVGNIEEPCVVRALQWTAADGLCLVGEGLIAAGIDIIDLELCTAFHPILFVFATPDGVVFGGDVLAFPSLCRGGSHYAESAALSADENSGNHGLAARSRSLEDEFVRSTEKGGQPLLRNIRVDLRGSDGSEAILQSGLQAWLADIMQIALIEPTSPACAHEKASVFLMDKAYSAPPRRPDLRAASPATLVLSAECVPTIAILASPKNGAIQSESAASISLICVANDPALGGLVAALPQAGLNYNAGLPEGAPIFWPQIVGACPSAGLVGGIRSDPDLRSDARLLEPSPHSIDLLGPAPRSAPITVLLSLDQWTSDALPYALHALRAQSDANIVEIYCIGGGMEHVAATLEEVVAVPVRWRSSALSILAEMHGELLLYIGSGVILHDPRTLAVLTDLVLGDGIVGASCPIVTHSRRGRDWSIGVEDAGLAEGVSGPHALAADATRFWNTYVPLVQLPQDLWLARKSAFDSESSTADHLILTTQLTASYYALRDPDSAPSPLALPTALRALQISRWLA